MFAHIVNLSVTSDMLNCVFLDTQIDYAYEHPRFIKSKYNICVIILTP